MITLKNISKWYGHFQVLTDCSTEVKKGEVVVVCGPSGSGKSTLIKTVNGLEPVQQGEITVDGIVVNDKKTDLAKLRSRVGMVFQHFELFPHLSIIENLTLAQVKVLKRDNNLTTAAICAALSVAAFSAMATDSTDTELTIIGEYTPGACTPVVTGGGIVDYGKHHNSALNPTGKRCSRSAFFGVRTKIGGLTLSDTDCPCNCLMACSTASSPCQTI